MGKQEAFSTPLHKLALIFWLAAFLFLSFVFPTNIRAAACTSVAGNLPWNNVASWAACGGLTPQAADTITIIANSTITMDTSHTVAGLTFTGGATANCLDQNGYLLTVNGTVTLNQPTASVTSLWRINNGTATVSGLITFAGANATAARLSKMTITSGQLNANGGLTFVASVNGSKVIDMSGGGGTLNMKGALTMPATSGTFTFGTSGSVFNYVDTTARTVVIPPAGAYHNLYLNNTNAAGATLGAAITAANVTGNIIVQTGLFKNGGFAIAGNAAKTFQVNDGAAFEMSGVSAFPTTFGTFTFQPTSTVRYLQTSTPLTISLRTYGNLDLKPAANTVTQNLPAGTLTVAGALTMGNGTNTGVIVNANANATVLNVSSSVAISANTTFQANAANTMTVNWNWSNSGTFTNNSGTVIFSTTVTGRTLAGTISGATGRFYNLTFDGVGGSWSNSAALEVANNFVITNGTVSAGNTITVTGNWTNNDTFLCNAQTVALNSAAGGKTIAGTLTGDNGKFYNLTFSGAGGWSATSAMEISNNLSMNAGTLTGTNDITVNGSATTAGTNGTITLTGGTFTQRVGAAGKTFMTVVATAVNWTFYNLVFSNSSGADQTITLNPTGTGAVIVSSGMFVGDASDTNLTILNDSTNNRIITVNGSLTITSKGTLQAGSGNLTIGGNYLNDGTFTAGTGTALFSGTTAGKTLSGTLNGTSKFNNVTLNGSINSTWVANSDWLIGAALTITSGTLQGTGNIQVNGAVAGNGASGWITLSGGTFTQRVAGASTFGSNVAGANNWTFNNLTFSNSAAADNTITTNGTGTGQIVVNGLLSVGNASDTNLTILNANTNDRIINANDVTITSKGTLQSASAQILYIAGAYTNNGTFTHNAGTVMFDATVDGETLSGTLNGTSLFNNLTFNGVGGGWTAATPLAAAGIFTMTAGTFTANNTLIVTGATNINGGLVNTNGISTMTAAVTLNGGNLDIESQMNMGANLAVTSGNLTGTGDITVVGAVTGNGTTGSINLTGGTFLHRVAAIQTFGTNAAGANNWTFNNLSFSLTGITARTITVNPTGTGWIVVTGTMTIGNAADAVVTTLSDSGNSRIFDVQGNVIITSKGALAAPVANPLYVGGDWTNSGTFTAGTGTVTFDASFPGATLNGTLTGATGRFYNLVFNGVGGAWSNAAALEINNNFTITNGTFTAANNVTVTGSWSNSATFTANTSTVTFNSVALGKTIAGNLSGTSAFYHLVFSGAAGGWSNTSAMEVDGDITVTAGTLSGTNDILLTGSLYGNGTNGTVNLTGGTFEQRVLAARTFGSNVAGAVNWTFNNLLFSNGSASDQTIVTNALGAGQIVVTGTLQVGRATDSNLTTLNNETNDRVINCNGNFFIDTNGSFTASSTALFYVAGNWTNSGTFTSGTGTVTFDATAVGNVIDGNLTGANDFYNVTFLGIGGGWSNIADMVIGNTLTVSTGTLSGTGNITVNGAVTGNGFAGIINLSGGTFEQRVAAPQTFGTNVIGAGNWTFNNLKFSNSSGANRAITTNATGTGQIIVNGALIIGISTDTNTTTLDCNTNDRIFNVFDATITSKGILLASSAQPLYIAGSYVNNGTFTHNAGVVTFDATAPGETLSGTLNGTSLFNNLVFNGSNGGWSNLSDMLVLSTLTVTAGTLSGSGNIIVNGGVVGDGTNGSINLSGGTFEQRVAAAQYFGTNAAGANNWTFNNLTFSNSSAGNLIVRSNATGTGQIIANGILSIGKVTDTNTTTLDLNTNDRIFNVNDATITTRGVLSASSAQPLYIAGAYLNNGTFTHNSGTVIFDAGVLGETLAGTLNGTSLFNNLTFNGTNGGWSNSSDLLVASTLTVTAGTLSGTGNITVYGGVAGDGTNGVINLTGGTFEQRVAAAQYFGTNAAGANDWTFNNLTFSNSSAGNLIIRANTAGTGDVVVTGTLNIGKVADTNTTQFDLSAANRLLNNSGNLAITTKGILAATASQPLYVGGSWTNNGTFTHNSSSVTLTGTGAQTVNNYGKAFGSLVSSNTSAGGVVFSSSFTAARLYVNTAGLSGGATLYFAGNSTAVVTSFLLNGTASKPIVLKSTTTNTVWTLNTVSTYTISYLQVQDSNANPGLKMIVVTGGLGIGNNFNWDFGAPAAISVFLASQGVMGETVRLSWNTPGDDGMTGILYNSSYTVQYTSITAFAESTGWDPTTDPQANVYRIIIATNNVSPNISVSTTIAALSEGDTYYFRIWTMDDSGLRSPISIGATNYATRVILSMSLSTDTIPVVNFNASAAVVISTSIIVTNESNVLTTFNFRAFTTTGSSPWTLGSSQGLNQYILWTAANASEPLSGAYGNEDKLTGSDTPCSATVFTTGASTCVNVPPGEQRTLWFKIGMPTAVNDLTEQTIRIVGTATKAY